MVTEKHKGKKAILWENAYLLVIVAGICLAGFVTVLLQQYTKDLLRTRLDEKLLGIASTAELNFEPQEILQIKKEGLKAVGTEIYRKNVLKLQAIRNADSRIKYAYIMAQTDNPNEVIYVVDADAMSIMPAIDFNEDGEINEEDVSKPGDVYEVSEAPMLQGPAFEKTTVDEELTSDTWGQFLSAYSPIVDEYGAVVGTLVIDVEVSDFQEQINATVLPFSLFILFLLLLISGLATVILRIWKSRVDAVKELDRQKDELIGIVSHQLAKPITAIKWNLELLLDGDIGVLAKEQQEMLSSMQDVTHHLTGLVDMILDVSRIQLGRINLEAQPLNLDQFFREIIQVIEPGSKERKQDFIKNVPENLPTVLLDKKYLRMTVENLLSNAVKYTPEGGTVELNIQLKEGKMFCFVKDTGCGIPKADQSKIFGKLYRASNVRNTVDGNGFGLYVAKGAIEGQGGRMWFESEEGKGTTFYFELPLKYPEPIKTVEAQKIAP